jgi:hypothetical protein
MTLFNTVGVTEALKQSAQQLLTQSEDALYDYWFSKIAPDYRDGTYLRGASLRSKRLLFKRWLNELKQIADAETKL